MRKELRDKRRELLLGYEQDVKEASVIRKDKNGEAQREFEDAVSLARKNYARKLNVLPKL